MEGNHGNLCKKVFQSTHQIDFTHLSPLPWGEGEGNTYHFYMIAEGIPFSAMEKEKDSFEEWIEKSD